MAEQSITEELLPLCKIVDELPQTGRQLCLEELEVDGEPCYVTIVETRSHVLYARVQTVAAVRQDLIERGWIKP